MKIIKSADEGYGYHLADEKNDIGVLNILDVDFKVKGSEFDKAQTILALEKKLDNEDFLAKNYGKVRQLVIL